MCFQFYEGKGYDADFTDHMGNVIETLSRDPAAPVVLTIGADAVCERCPNDRSGICADREKSDRYDKAVLRLCGLRNGDALPYAEFLAAVRKKILIPSLRAGICGDCCRKCACRALWKYWKRVASGAR